MEGTGALSESLRRVSCSPRHAAEKMDELKRMKMEYLILMGGNDRNLRTNRSEREKQDGPTASTI